MKRLLRSFTTLLGSLGVLLCLAAAVGAWFVGARLNQATDRVFDGVDKSLVASRERVLSAQKRVQESKITTDDVGQAVQNWIRAEAPERLASRLKVEEKTEQLATGLRQADQWLEVSGESLQGVQKILEIAGSLGAPSPERDVAVVDPLLDKLAVVRRQLQQSAETVDAIRSRMAEGDTLEERLRQVAQLTLRVVATFSEIDSRLGEFSDGLVATRARVEQHGNQTHNYIVAAQIAALLLIVWMAAGQASLARRSRSI